MLSSAACCDGCRCHVPGGKLGTNYPKRFLGCITKWAGMTPEEARPAPLFHPNSPLSHSPSRRQVSSRVLRLLSSSFHFSPTFSFLSLFPPFPHVSPPHLSTLSLFCSSWRRSTVSPRLWTQSTQRRGRARRSGRGCVGHPACHPACHKPALLCCNPLRSFREDAGPHHIIYTLLWSGVASDSQLPHPRPFNP